MAATLLPDDLVREILLRVSIDVPSLFRRAVTCKRWRALVTARSFLRRRWPSASVLLGFFNVRYDAPCFSPVPPGSLLGAQCRCLTSIISDESYDDVLDRAVPLATRDGLLLMRLHSEWIHLAVCNVLTGTCDVLPPLKCRGSCWHSVILTREDCPSLAGQDQGLTGYTTFFKVLAIVCSDDGGDYNLYTFLSTQPNWSEPTEIFDQVWQQDRLDLRFLPGMTKVVVCRGVAHWLLTYYTNPGTIVHYYSFDVNVETCSVSLTELSIPANQLATTTYDGLMLTVTIDGSLALLHLDDYALQLNTWTQDGETWLCTRVVKLKPPKDLTDLSYVRTWLGQKSGMLFIRRDDRDRLVYKVDTETGAMDDVTTKMFEAGLDMMAVPVEIDLPALFISRLSVDTYSQS